MKSFLVLIYTPIGERSYSANYSPLSLLSIKTGESISTIDDIHFEFYRLGIKNGSLKKLFQ